MNILAIDTSTSLASIAIASNEQILAESLINTDRTLSARLMPEVERLLTATGLTYARVDLFASSIGPGSFTGIRGGVATIQGMSFAVSKPCVGLSSLAMLAMNFSLSSLLICPLLDARKSEVYAALYNCSSPIPVPRITDSVLSPEALFDRIDAVTEDPVIFIGEGVRRYHAQIATHFGNRAIFPPFPLNILRAANGIMLALHAFQQGRLLEPSQLLPIYLRPSDAELMKIR